MNPATDTIFPADTAAVFSDGPVDPHAELYSHPSVQTEWWYYSGHLCSGGRRFGFQLTFFHRRPDGIRFFGRVPIRIVSRLFKFAHFAITDIDGQQFHFSHQRSLYGTAGASTDRLHVWHRHWRVREDQDQHHLAARSPAAELQLTMTPQKPMIRQGNDGEFQRVRGQLARQVSIPRMQSEGWLTLRGRRYPVEGIAWMDREYGFCDFGPHLGGWDWFAVQLDNDHELMIYRVCDEHHRYNGHQTVTLIDREGQVSCLPATDFRLEVQREWVSPWTGTRYPAGWDLEIPDWGTRLQIQPWLSCQELDTRGSTSVIYWEGGSRVSGQFQDRPVSGNAYVELVGYDTSHLVMSHKWVGFPEIYRAWVNDLHYHLHHRNCTRSECGSLDRRSGDSG